MCNRSERDAVQGIAEEMLEAVARAMYEQCWGGGWEEEHPSKRDAWRGMVRAGLKAAGSVTAVHLCDTCAQSMCRRRRDIEDACEDALFPARAVVVECKAYVADKQVQEVLASARQGSASEG